MRLALLSRFLLISVFLILISGCVERSNNKSTNIFLKLDYPPPTEFEYAVYQHINKVRQERNLPGYVYDNRLGYIARSYSRDMYHRRFFGHIDPEGGDVGSRLISNNYLFFAVGENLIQMNANCDGEYLINAKRIVDGWLGSVGHRRLILNEDMSNVGIGIFCMNGILYGTMLTSRPCKSIDVELVEGIMFTYDIGNNELMSKKEHIIEFSVVNSKCGVVNVNIISNNTLISMNKPKMIEQIKLPFQIALNAPFECNVSIEICFRNDIEVVN
ncbi:MAG: CAP domain-containing protein [Candidatus Micrarchaeota archaeon]|nr:CAP domain-containing protein [Candidatus Micrarchaeota archaeon]MCX8154595.1 CAP domain-containing protein [Candidatus Micrarchaeota archaeon]